MQAESLNVTASFSLEEGPVPMRAWLGIVAVVLLGLIGCLDTPIAWSPDGRWVAYVLAARPNAQQAAWALDPVAGRRAEEAADAEAPRITYRIWATRPETRESVLLEESAGPITSPCWSPDGTALAFGRLTPQGVGRARFEVVIQDAPNHQRVIQSTEVHPLRADTGAESLPALSLAWSPDGRFLAAPQVEPRGLAILRTDTGKLLKTVEGGYFPSWSPDGTKLAFYQEEKPASLYTMDGGLGSARQLIEVGRAPKQPPVWARDSRSLLVIRTKLDRGNRGTPAERIELIRVRSDNGTAQPIKVFSDDPYARNKTFQGVTFTFDRDGDELFYSAAYEGQPSVITWYRPRENTTYKTFNPYHTSMPLGGLALAPTGKWLALRVGAPGIFAPVGLVDIETGKLTPVVPDDATRLAWVATTLATVRQILKDQPGPGAGPDKPGIERATLLPAPGELSNNGEPLMQLHRMGRIGRSLCERPAEAPAPDGILQATLDEGKLVFDYLQDDYQAALADLPAVEARAKNPDQRLRLLALRAQIYLGLKDSERAEATISYLQSAQPREIRRLEMTPQGPKLLTEPAPGVAWAEYLAGRAEGLRQGVQPLHPDEDPSVPTNPDNPLHGAPGIESMPGQALPQPFQLPRELDPPAIPRIRQRQ